MPVCPNKYVSSLVAYVPGEQPRGSGFIKLNTNENPYPPSPSVTKALSEIGKDGMHLNKYPDPWANELRKKYAEIINFSDTSIIVGNGSDEILRMIFEAFATEGDTLVVADPTYVLYETLASMFGCKTVRYPLSTEDFTLPEAFYGAEGKILILPNPNPPYGICYGLETLERIAAAKPERLVVFDEAYIDFTENPRGALDLALRYDNVMVTRTFSKGWSLAGGRIGFACMNPALFESMAKVKDSYNVNKMSQVAASAALDSAEAQRENNGRIVALRSEIAEQLRKRGFTMPPSNGNFVFARGNNAPELYRQLKEHKVLVRWFDTPLLRDGLRITIGTTEEMRVFLEKLDLCLASM
ncbi:histidinol-phosphate transaminase [Candidatus Sumerlaeota bacterium]|nr:histidinol-phosphate transaminase [Candidatus Sumerlaeota bacterium]